MRRRIMLVVGLFALLVVAPQAGAVELRFEAGKSANLFWMVDQLSQWDARYTSPSYRQYWQTKVKLTDADYAVLDRFARLRQRYARLDEKEVRRETSPWNSLFGQSTILPHERFALAFLETRTPMEAVALLKMPEEDQQVVIGTLKHFARLMKDHYGTETAHLAAFAQKAHVLISLADAGGFIDDMKSFFGLTGAIPQTIPVDVLWAPPGFVSPTHMGYHIILPVSVDKAESDEAVLQHLSMAVQEVGQYLVSKLPVDTLTRAGSAVLRECGLVNEARPEMVRTALQVALGEGIFLRQRFPDLPASPVMVPWDANLEFPFATDELAREYVGVLKTYFTQPAGFYPGFVGKAIEVQKSLFPPRPRFFAPTAVLMADATGRELFAGLFSNVDRREFDLSDEKKVIEAIREEPDRAVFIVVNGGGGEGAMYSVLKRVTDWRRLAGSFRKLRKSSFIYPIPRRDGGTIFVVHGLDATAVRNALVRLYTMDSIPSSPIVIQ